MRAEVPGGPVPRAAAHGYEVSDYRRVPVTVASGPRAWVHIAS